MAAIELDIAAIRLVCAGSVVRDAMAKPSAVDATTLMVPATAEKSVSTDCCAAERMLGCTINSKPLQRAQSPNALCLRGRKMRCLAPLTEHVHAAFDVSSFVLQLREQDVDEQQHVCFLTNIDRNNGAQQTNARQRARVIV